MTFRLEDKKAIVAEIANIASNAHSVVAAEYRGLTAEEMTEFRANARRAGVYVRVVRNTLARRALANTQFACMEGSLVGPLILAFSKEEPGAAARLVRDFSKSHDKLLVKSISVGGKVLPVKDINMLANLPTRPQAILLLMSIMKAPIVQYVRTMRESYAKLVRTMAAVRDNQKA